MVKNLQCPVCTLYLHAGINLCDHLETHPKEQVIQALVQMTILGSEHRLPPSLPSPSHSSSIELHNHGTRDGGVVDRECEGTERNLLTNNVPDKEIIKHVSTTATSIFAKDNELSNSSNSSHSVSTINVVSNQSSANKKVSINNGNSFGERTSTDANSNFSNNSELNGSGWKFISNNSTNTNQSYASPTIQLNIQSGAPTDSAAISNLRYHQQQQSIQFATDYFRNNGAVAGHSSNQQSTLNTGIIIQNEMPTLHLPPSTHASNRQSQVYSSHQEMSQQQHIHPVHLQQNLLHQQNIFPAELPPPPPLQLFTYQSTVASHQKPPPPAYGTAISQIRSQSKNQHKQQQYSSVQTQEQMAPSLLSSNAKQHQQRQRQQHHQSQQQQDFQHTNAPSQIQQQESTQPLLENSSNSQFERSTKIKSFRTSKNLVPSSSPAPLSFVSLSSTSASTQKREFATQKNLLNLNANSSNTVGCETHFKSNRAMCNIPTVASETLNVATTTTTTTTTTAATLTKNTYPSVSSMTSKHTNSPCPILLPNSSATAPSVAPLSTSTTTSVLRYAESPVAHYLERDNGDFIVQETPKHIMEYVEKDDGEFSVIERIYQSPPSILHIHDECDEDDDDNDDKNDGTVTNNKDNITHINTKGKNNSNINNSKSLSNNNGVCFQKEESQNRISQINMKKINDTSTDAPSFSDIEDDFRSISGESDQEEFVEHNQLINKAKQQQQQSQNNKSAATSQMVVNQIDKMVQEDDKTNLTSKIAVSATQASVNTTNNHASTAALTITTSTTAPATTTMRKKSSKNSVTVLSDVQLNLSEYLDLVGNIIASSKISAQRKSTAATVSTTAIANTAAAPLPLVKIEKEEPLDEYSDTESKNYVQSEIDKQDEINKKFENIQLRQETEQCQEQQYKKAVASSKVKKPETYNDVFQNQASHVVNETILSFKNKLDTNGDVEKKPSVMDYNNKTESAISPSAYSATNYSNHATTSVIRMASTIKQVNNPEFKQKINNVGKNPYASTNQCERNIYGSDVSQAEDLSKSHAKVKQQNYEVATTTSITMNKATAVGTGGITVVPSYSGSLHGAPLSMRKGPKKLIIKPKSSITKTETIMPNNNSSSSNQGCDSKAISCRDDQKPSTSAKAKEEYNKLRQRTITTTTTSSKSKSTRKTTPGKSDSTAQKKSEPCESIPIKLVTSIAANNNNYNNTEFLNLSGRDYETGSPSNCLFSASDNVIKVKNEPLSLENYESSSCFTNAVIEDDAKQQHQHQQETYVPPHIEDIMLCKEEKPCIVGASMPMDIIMTPVKAETNINDDARVLYNFANSHKLSINEAVTTIMTMTTTATTTTTDASIRTTTSLITNCNEENDASLVTTHKDIGDVHETIIASSNTSSSQLPIDSHIQRHGVTSLTLGHTDAQQNQSAHNFVDYPFSFLYNNTNLSQQVDIKCSQTSLYQNVAGASSSTSSTTFSSHNVINVMMNVDGSMKNNDQNKTNLESTEWFHNDDLNNTSTSTSTATITLNNSNNVGIDFNSSLSVDCNANLNDGGSNNDDVSKYLDLDACKREQKFGMTRYHHHQQSIEQHHQQQGSLSTDLPLSSSNSCSFTENIGASLVNGSVAGGGSSSTATINIRTDEKMPAKGEISEQESNCDIDNSWSQPMYGDISARFFKTSFPGMFTHDSGWHHDDCFTVHDLSASTISQAQTQTVSDVTSINTNNNRIRSFDLRLPLTTNETYNNGGHQQPNFPLGQVDHIDSAMPSTSTKNKKRRKRPLQDNKTMPQSQQQQQEQHQCDRSLDLHVLDQLPVSSSVSLGLLPETFPSSSNIGNATCTTTFGTHSIAITSSTTLQQQHQHPHHRVREKVYECARCFVKYSKLKDRNAHMINVHNYIRQNRKLVCPQSLVTSTVTSNEANTSENANVNVNVNTPEIMITAATTIAPSTTICSKTTESSGETVIGNDQIEDSKHGIVKVEHSQTLTPLQHVETNFIPKDSKELEIDDKQKLSLLSTSDNLLNVQPTALDQKDIKYSNALTRLGFNAPATKLTGLYRMLVNYNMSNLKIKQDLSEVDEHLMQSLIFYCHLCRQSFSSVKLYDIHLTEHPAECFSCGKKFQRWKNLSLHLKRHMGLKEFGCNVCDKKFVVRSALVEHMRMHSGQSPLKCKICGKHFKRYSNLTQHRKRHTKQVLRRKEYVCYCGEVLPSKARFLWHKETHDSKPKCCNYCCDRFIHVNSLKRHIRLAHSDKFDYVEPMECPICKQVFAKASMKSHMATHSTDNQYDCTICNKTFSTKWNLKIHSWVHANRTAKPFKCDHCPKAFVREIDFKNHINSHKQIRPYTCEVCGCKFIRKYNYMRHRREHHGDKKFTCDLCKKSFHRHYYLIEHRRIHTGERPFQCTICGKSSTTKTNHNKHMKIHHSRDPFTVEV